LSKQRKTGALRSKEADSRYTNNQRPPSDIKTFYTNESKTIDFSQAYKPKQLKKSIDLIPKSVNQEKYIISLLDEASDIVVVSGPAGTGKTYLAMLAAIKGLRANKFAKLVLTRPAVSVEAENHGFLPGDLNQKLEPWVRPLIDVLRDHYNSKELEYMLEEQVIEFAPLGMMRGRTFKESFIILDEAQNASPNMMKMLMTRIGYNSKIVITGDTEQGDRRTFDNGLLDLIHRLGTRPVNGIAACELQQSDIQRHKIIEQVLRLYQQE
tara:strand:- start:150 stop:950 length:801 start_codon:yes stop_codon:yes gene_type:complete